MAINKGSGAPLPRQTPTKGSRQMKKPEIVWFFTKQGGGRYPQTKLFPVFSPNFFIALK